MGLFGDAGLAADSDLSAAGGSLPGAGFSGLGLPVPVLVAGQVLRGAVGCLGAAEPSSWWDFSFWGSAQDGGRRQPFGQDTWGTGSGTWGCHQ